ncbi:hypothetical protein DB347_22675 [Opitutaceae bacterium EW11]|nr:hypothetical protein DB347_22675 [Opitutaceae bacterium EW11]
MTTYTKEELTKAADRVFHNISQLFGYYAWVGKIAPTLASKDEGAQGHLYFVLAQNAVVDGYLINLRRLNEFFSKRPDKSKDEEDDDLRAYHFGFPEIGRFLDPQDMKELHKRIAHSTNRTALVGDVSYEAKQAAELALKHAFQFLEHILRTFYTDGSPESNSMKDACIVLIGLWSSWCKEAEQEKA